MTHLAHIHLITGGQRSGKSSYAETLALKLSSQPIYMATSRVWDDGHKQRIERHKSDRGDQWITIEEEKYLSNYSSEKRVILVDCVTLWLTNFFFDTDSDISLSLELAKQEFDKLLAIDSHFIFVTNEIGMGAFPIDKLQIAFTDLQGWMNQYIAKKADEVTLMVSGIPVRVK